MNYFTRVNKDIWYIVAKYLSYEQLALLYDQDHIVYKEYFQEEIASPNHITDNYKTKIETVYNDIKNMNEEDILTYSCVHGYLTLMIKSIQRGSLNIQRTIMIKKIHPMIKRAVPLIVAASHGHLELVKYLIENCPVMHTLDDAMSYAARKGHMEVEEYLSIIVNGKLKPCEVSVQ